MQDISLAVCGQARHGKSTLLGKAVSEFGMVSQRQLEAARTAAREGKDPSYVFANLVFRSKKVAPQSEAGRGVTYQTAIIRFEFGDRRVTAIDTPGQEDYTNNLFIGMFQADGALLLVAGHEGIMPVTEQILRILIGFEIPLLGVSITKMDMVDYRQEDYEARVVEVREHCRALGVKDPDKIIFFPTSAYHSGRDLLAPGEGIKSFEHCKWFRGPTFYDFLARLDLRKIRGETGPLRAVVHPTDAYDNVPGIGKCVTAVIESGVMRKHMKLIFEPISTEAGSPITAEVRSLELTRGHIATPGIPIEEAHPRQLVGVALRMGEKSLRETFNGRGIVMGPVDNPPGVAQDMIIEFTIFDAEIKVRIGEEWVLHAHLDHVVVSIQEILAYRIGSDQKWIDGGGYGAIEVGDWGRVRVVAKRPIALETESVLPFLSRIVIRKESRAVGFGRCVGIKG